MIYPRFVGAALVFMLAALPATGIRGEPVRVMTFNLRYGTAPDGENAWPLRRELLMKVIRDFDPDMLGVQEALRMQLDAIGEAFPGYSLVGVGREADGGGEYSAIFYRRTRFDLCAADTFWLSATPEKPGSTTWGNHLPRVCTWVRVLDHSNHRRFWVFNTHWDHESQPARLESGQLMSKRIAERAAIDEPALATGDFNAGEENPGFIALKQGAALTDTYRALHPEGPAGTFNGFTGVPGKEKIDAVLATSAWRVLDARIVHDHDGNRYPSDHFPVTATVSLE